MAGVMGRIECRRVTYVAEHPGKSTKLVQGIIGSIIPLQNKGFSANQNGLLNISMLIVLRPLDDPAACAVVNPGPATYMS
jgi:hypothetical protein